LDSLLHYIIWDPGIDLVELFFGGIIRVLWHRGGDLRTFSRLEFIGSSHPIWMMKSMHHMTSPFFLGTILKIDGDMSWRDGIGGDT
jgi:hypothetical protein